MGQSLLKLVREKPDVLIMDIVLPKLEGFGVLRILNETEGRKPAVLFYLPLTIKGWLPRLPH